MFPPWASQQKASELPDGAEWFSDEVVFWVDPFMLPDVVDVEKEAAIEALHVFCADVIL
jgi:hypothetical protein